MKKNGFTLVELLAVIVLLALLMTIALPSALRMASRVRGKTYNSKIELIEKAAENFGISNSGLLQMGINPNSLTGTVNTSTAHRYACKFTFAKDDSLSQVSFTDKGVGDSAKKNSDEYWCFRITVADLVGTDELSWDAKNVCSEKNCTTANKKYYDNVVTNPSSNFIINECYIYVYYRNSRVYSVYDKKTCDMQSNNPADAGGGHEYRPLA